jgi:hypothetical protein
MLDVMKDPDSAESKGCTLLGEAMGYVGHGSKSAFAEYIGIELEVWSNVESRSPY